MVLPTSGPLSVQGPPGSLGGTKSKRAIVVKLPDEIVQALIARRQSNPNDPPLDLDFGDRPGIHIGGNFFPTEFAREKRTHEIFSLASNKAQGPLRHYASVEGNILVKRVLNDRISSRVKKSSEASEKKAKARPIQILDTPPATGRAGSKAPKKKAAATKPASLQARNASMPSTTGASISSTRNGSTSTTPGRVNSPLPSPIPKPVLTDNQNYMRYRLIHFLALTPKTSADVFRNVGGPTCEVKVRSQISIVLSLVATEDPPPKKSDLNPQPRLWRLKTESWFDVRPYDYPSLSDDEREKIGRQAQHILRKMGVSETDPRWEHVKDRSLSGSANSQGSSSASNRVSKTAKPRLDTSRDPSPLPVASAPSSGRKAPSAQRVTPQSKTSASHSKEIIRDQHVASPEPRKAALSSRAADTIRDSISKQGADNSKRKRDRDEDTEDEMLKTSETKRRKSEEDEINISHSSRSATKTSKKSNVLRPTSTTTTPSGSKPHMRPITPTPAAKTIKANSSNSSRRRRSPIYTSTSESEDEFPQKKSHKAALKPPPAKPGPSPRPTNGHMKPLSYTMPKIAFGGPLPEDHVSLRKRYNAIYPSYISVYQKCVEQRMAIEKLLEDSPPAEEGEVEEELMVGGDIEMMDASDLESLNTDFLKLENELSRINAALRSASR